MLKYILILILVASSIISHAFNVTFRVNMQNAPSFTQATVNATFNNWCGNCNPMTDANGDGVWETTITLNAGYYEYKFAADAWNIQETLLAGTSCTNTTGQYTNRTLNVTGSLVLPIVCWGECSNCTSFPVTFQVNMNAVSAYTPPYLSGTFNSWCGNCNALSDANGDNIWTTTIFLNPGVYEYKFSADNWAISENLVPGSICTVTNFGYTNRSVTITAPTILNAYFWGACTITCPPEIPLPDPNISIKLVSNVNPICSGAEAVFVANTSNLTNIPSFQWKVDDVNVGGNSQVFSTNSLIDGQLVSCVMTGADFCNTSNAFSSNAIAIQVKPIVNAGVSVEYSPNNPVNPCYGDLLSFNAITTNGGLNPQYQWMVNGQNIGDNTSLFQSQDLTDASVISCTMISNEQCLSEQWNRVWADEFSGASYDTTNWIPEIYTNNGELQTYTNSPENIQVNDGQLHLIAKDEGANVYTSGRLITRNKFSFKYGRVEGRMKVPQARGSFPAFWMLGANIKEISWPACGELDIMEHINSENKFYGTVHWDNGGHTLQGSNLMSNAALYHTFSTEWDSTRIRIYLDGVQYYEHVISAANSTLDEFTKPFFLLLNHAVAGWADVPDNTSVFPSSFDIDYVRVYQKNKSNGTLAPSNVISNVLTLNYVDCLPTFNDDSLNEQLAQKHFNLFPNPNSGTFIFQGKLGESYFIVNELGQVISKIELKNSESLEITGLQSGMYVVVSTTGLERKKIIVVD
jgi:beta-glucanase (GH16 family)